MVGKGYWKGVLLGALKNIRLHAPINDLGILFESGSQKGLQQYDWGSYYFE